MYSIRKTNSKIKLSNFVNGVSQENFIFLVSFLFIGASVFLITPFLVNNHKRAVARNEWRKTQESIPLGFTSGIPSNTRRLSLDSNEYYQT
uniref:Uncharacterized protein n=1 Tax=viral metagenome TaxID=1070528 RepID=A0A6C0IXZ8_9ZZZZ